MYNKLKTQLAKVPVKTYRQVVDGIGKPHYELNDEEVRRFWEVFSDKIGKGKEIVMCKIGNNSSTSIYGGIKGVSLEHIKESDVCYILGDVKSISSKNSSGKKGKEVKERYSKYDQDLFK